MLFGSILLAFAWAALQGEITLLNLVVGYVLGYAALAFLGVGGVLPSTLSLANRPCRRARRILHPGAGAGQYDRGHRRVAPAHDDPACGRRHSA